MYWERLWGYDEPHIQLTSTGSPLLLFHADGASGRLANPGKRN